MARRPKEMGDREDNHVRWDELTPEEMLKSIDECGAASRQAGWIIDTASEDGLCSRGAVFSCFQDKRTAEEYKAMPMVELLLRMRLSQGEAREIAEYRAIKKMEEAYERLRKDLVHYIKLAKDLGVMSFQRSVVERFMKENELVGDYVGSFFSWISSLLPTDFVELFYEDGRMCRHFDKVFAKKYGSYRVVDHAFCENMDPRRLARIDLHALDRLVQYSGVREYFCRHVMFMEEGARLHLIAKHLKREDFEYYLNILAEESQEPEKYRASLQDYLKNGVVRERSSRYSIFMRMYNRMRGADDDDMSLGARRIAIESLRRLFRGYDVKELLESDIGAIFVSRTIGYVVKYIDEIEECGRIVSALLEENKSKKINNALWNALSQKKDALIRYIGEFRMYEDENLAVILLHEMRDSLDVSLHDLIGYGYGKYKKETIEYALSCFSASDMVDVLLKQDEDERGFLLECLYGKALAGEFDLRIFDVEDVVWTDVIFNEIFKTLDDGIYEKLWRSRPELVFDYCFRHADLRRRYFERVEKRRCTVEDGVCIHKILRHEMDAMERRVGDESYAMAVYGDAEGGNEIYAISVCVDPVLSGSVVEFVYLLTLIRPDEARYYLCEYFEEFFREIGSLRDEAGGDVGSVLGLCDMGLVRSIPLSQMVEGVFSVHLRDKHLVYTVMDALLEKMRTCSQTLKLAILRNMSSGVVTSHHIVQFINILVPLLHDSNARICAESKRLLCSVSIASPELICLRSQLVQAVLNKMYAKPFFAAVRTQLFNHYVCFNGLNLLVQVLSMYIKDFREDVFPILGNLESFVRSGDLERVFPVIFDCLSLFVIENTFYIDECCGVASSMMKYSRDVTFGRLLSSLNVALRVNKFLIRCLGVCSEERMEEVINRIVKKRDGELQVEPMFLAYAPELPVFERYIPVFRPVLKDLFLSSSTANQEIAFRAFETMDMDSFLLFCCIVGQWRARLLCIELFSKKDAAGDAILAMLFILKNDPHSAVRKKAVDVWKQRVSNANVALRTAYRAVLGCLRYKNNTDSFQNAVMGALNDMATKYDRYIEKYVEERASDANPLGLKEELGELGATGEKDVVETILVECVRLNKHLGLALSFSTENSSVYLFKLLAKKREYKKNVIEAVSREINNPAISQIFMNDSLLALDLFRATGETFLFRFMNDSDQIELLETLLVEEKENGEKTKNLVRNMHATQRLEQVLLGANPIYTSAFYSSQERLEDFGGAKALFCRAFSSLGHGDLQGLVAKRYLGLLLDVTYKNIDESGALLAVLCTSNAQRAFERIGDVVRDMEVDNLYPLCGHLLRNYLVYDRREGVLPSLRMVRQRYRDRLGMFDLILKRALG